MHWSTFKSRKFLSRYAGCTYELIQMVYPKDHKNTHLSNQATKKRNQWLTASKVVRADNLLKRNIKRSPIDMNYESITLTPEDKTELKMKCKIVYEFLTTVARERTRISIMRPNGMKAYRWYCDGKVKLRALLPSLQKTFYPAGLSKPAKHRNSSDCWIGSAVDDYICDYFKKTAGPAFLKFHHEINCEQECKLMLAKSVDKNSDDNKDTTKETDDNKAKYREKMSKIYSKAILSEIERKGIVIVAVQVILFDPSQRIISFADAIGICMNTYNIVVLEFKTGADYAYNYSKGRRMKDPLEAVPLSVKNIHMLQLWWYFDVCRRRYNLTELSYKDGYIIKANSKNCKVNPIVSPDGTKYHMNGEWFRLEPWTNNNKDRIYSALIETA